MKVLVILGKKLVIFVRKIFRGWEIVVRLSFLKKVIKIKIIMI